MTKQPTLHALSAMYLETVSQAHEATVAGDRAAYTTLRARPDETSG